MWICPKCGRTFQRTNQGHYCGDAPTTVDAFIEMQQEEARPHAVQLRTLIRTYVPEASERIAWSMPNYEWRKQPISFSVCKQHLSLYVDAGVISAFQSELQSLSVRKNAIYLPFNKPLPIDLLQRIVLACFFLEEQENRRG